MVYIKWFSLFVAIASFVVAVVFVYMGQRHEIKQGATSTIYEIKQLKLSQNSQRFWYRLDADDAREEPIYLGGLKSNIFSYMMIKNIVFQASIKPFGHVEIKADAGMIDLPLKHVQLHDPIVMSSNLGLSGYAYNVDINLQTGVLTLKNAYWKFQYKKNRRIEENWGMRPF